MKKFLLILTTCIVSLITVAAQTPGATMYIMIKKADVRASAGFFTSSRGTLEQGSPVIVIQTRDKWTEIRSASPPLSGWIASAALTGKRLLPSGHTLKAGEVAMAGKGFSGEVEQIYREGERLDYLPVDAMESSSIPEQELYAFLVEGRLATGE
jgi:hypothetical protein